MRGWIILVLLLAAPGAVACQVSPMLEFRLDEVPRCSPAAPEECDPVPPPGEPRTYDGAVRWYWDVDECTTQSGILQDDMQITFSGAGSNPAWLDVTFAPETITIPMHEYYDPTYLRFDGDRLYSEKEEAFQVRFDFLRMPVDAERDQIDMRDGLVMTFLKAKAEGEGARESFAVKAVAFDGRHLVASPPVGQRDDVQQEAPVPFLPALVALAGAAAWRRQTRRT